MGDSILDLYHDDPQSFHSDCLLLRLDSYPAVIVANKKNEEIVTSPHCRSPVDLSALNEQFAAWSIQ